MTLILTEISKLGIVMVGDTAITIDCLMPDHTMQSRSLDGIAKVIPVNKINAGISIWGWTHVDPFNDIKGIPIDWWINNLLIENNSNYENIDQLARILVTNLNTKIPELSDGEFKENEYGNGGIHLVGYDYINGSSSPSFWHIHNGRSQALGDKGINPLIVNANHDLTPLQSQELISRDRGYYTVNGENETFNMFVRQLATFLRDRFEEEKIIIPVPNLMARAKFWRAIIVFISNLFQVSGSLIRTKNYDMIFDYPTSVGDEVSILTINREGLSNLVTF